MSARVVHFEVPFDDDIGVAMASIVEHGGEQVGETLTVGEMGFAAYFHDSEGNLTGLWQSA